MYTILKTWLLIIMLPAASTLKVMPPQAVEADTLLLTVERIAHGKPVLFSLQRKASDNYPYYISGKPWKTGERYRVIFRKLPASGYIYIFRMDAMNNAVRLSVLKIDTPGAVTPFGSGPVLLEYDGLEHLCIWFSHSEIRQFDKLLRAMELTSGEFSQRCNAMLVERLLLPDSIPHFEKSSIGFISHPPASAEKDGAVISVVIRFTIIPVVSNKK